MKKRNIIAIATGLCGMLSACDSFDCSLENTVLCQMAFYGSTGESITLSDTLTVVASGTDSVLYNRGVSTSEVGIPLSYYKDKDTLTLRLVGTDYSYEDQLVIAKTNTEHFESLDCPVKMFHTLTGVESTNKMIDSVKISSPDVKYNNGENIKIYMHTAE